MPNSPAEEEPSRRDSDATIPPEGAAEQEQEGPGGHEGKTFTEHARESMEEHAELGRLLDQWENSILGRERRDCQKTFGAGRTEVINLPAEAVQTHTLDEKSLWLPGGDSQTVIRGRCHRQRGPRERLETGRRPFQGP